MKREEYINMLVEQFMHIQLSRNEALAYITLLEDDGEKGLTGYEVAARSSIPRSAVYKVLRKLEQAEGVFSYGDTQKFVAIRPEVWLNKLERKTLSHYQKLKQGIQKIPKYERPEPIFLIQKYSDVLHQISQLIIQAQHSIYLSICPQELAILAPALLQIKHKDLHCVLYSPTYISNPPLQVSCWFEQEPNDKKEHNVVVVIDHKQALLGGTIPNVSNHAVHTSNPSLVHFATLQIVLQIQMLAQKQHRDCSTDTEKMLPQQTS